MEPPSAVQLAAIPFLKGMQWRHLEALAACAMPVRFEAGAPLFNTDEPANRFYLVQKGRVSLETRKPDHSVVPVQIVEAGDVLGWSWLFPPHVWRFDARALEEVEAIFFYAPRLRDLAAEDPAFCCSMMGRMTQVILARLQATRGQLVEALSAPGREAP